MTVLLVILSIAFLLAAFDMLALTFGIDSREGFGEMASGRRSW
jgi:hypothetical protein